MVAQCSSAVRKTKTNFTLRSLKQFIPTQSRGAPNAPGESQPPVAPSAGNFIFESFDIIYLAQKLVHSAISAFRNQRHIQFSDPAPKPSCFSFGYRPSPAWLVAHLLPPALDWTVIRYVHLVFMKFGPAILNQHVSSSRVQNGWARHAWPKINFGAVSVTAGLHHE